MITYKELSSLEADLNFSVKTLYRISNNIKNHYHRVELPKKNGGIRVLSVPDKILKLVQKSIADKILIFYPVSAYATAYKHNTSIIKNAKRHVNQEKILKLDIYKFFDNIQYSQIKNKVFKPEIFSEQIRILLTMLCYYEDILPQGAPTSPVISNIIMYDFDENVGKWCKENNINYTRYCDDMTFSGAFDEKTVIDFISQELKSNGFILNRKKSVVVTPKQRQTVTGIVVNEKLNITKEYRKQIRKEVFYCKKFGVENHLNSSCTEQNSNEYLKSLLGRINFVLQVIPNNIEFIEYKDYVLQLMKNN